MTERPTILVDTREQLPLRFSDAVAVERATLPAGDYSIAGLTDRVALERKSLDDLVQSITWERERFLDCCRRLAGYSVRAIVVEASVADVLGRTYRSQANPSSVLGTTVALFVDYGVGTIWAGSPETAAQIVEKLLVRMWRRAKKGDSNGDT